MTSRPSFRFSIAILVLALVTGCTMATSADMPADLPSGHPSASPPTATAGVQAAAEETPTSTPAPHIQVTATQEPATSTPEHPPPAPTPVSTTTLAAPIMQTRVVSTPVPSVEALLPPQLSIPSASIQILSPGPASKVTNPFILRARVPPGQNGIVRIELLGEDGRLLMREVKAYSASQGWQVNVNQEVSFGISAVAEAARLQISVEDENGQVMDLDSVDLILLSIGEADLNPPGDLLERIAIQAPEPDTLVQGGTLRVSGLARPLTAKPLMVELKSADGGTVGTRQVEVVVPAGEGHGVFAIDVPYTVGEPTRARLLVWEPGERIPGVAALSSLELLLSP